MLFFGDRNAMAEFFVAPSFEGSTGFRIIGDSTGTYLLEVKRIPNYKEAEQEASEEYPSVGIPAEMFFSMPEAITKIIGKHNSDIAPKRAKKRIELYKIETLSFPISGRFAEKLYAKMVSAIDNFKVKGKPSTIFDGYRVTFRCVVGDELRTLSIHMPQDDILVFSDFCQQLIADAEAGTFDETKYLKLLKN